MATPEEIERGIATRADDVDLPRNTRDAQGRRQAWNWREDSGSTEQAGWLRDNESKEDRDDPYVVTTQDKPWQRIRSELVGMGGESGGTWGWLGAATKVSEIEQLHGKERIEAVRKYVQEQSKVDMPDDRPTVYVKFKGAAAKYFEQSEDVDRESRAGGRSSASASVLPSVKDAKAIQAEFLRQHGVTGGG